MAQLILDPRASTQNGFARLSGLARIIYIVVETTFEMGLSTAWVL